MIDEKTATGVSFIKDNIKHTVRARKEVVLTAGAINNPQLLMLSGIGPKKHLQQMHVGPDLLFLKVKRQFIYNLINYFKRIIFSKKNFKKVVYIRKEYVDCSRSMKKVYIGVG